VPTFNFQLLTFNFLFLLFLSSPTSAQLKYVIEDFEGFSNGTSVLKLNGIFTFGNIKATIDSRNDDFDYSGSRYIILNKEGTKDFGGWGKGIGMNIDLDYSTDYLNFYLNASESCTMKIELQEDDNADNIYEKTKDDSWLTHQKIEARKEWQLISIPFLQFKDENAGGDAIFNCTYKEGKLLTFIITFLNTGKNPKWQFDFISLSKGKLPVGPEMFNAPTASANDFCALGVWSTEGNTANFADIPKSFENFFSSDKKLAVAHFFQPFAFDGGTQQNHYPSVERINKVIEAGYIPMITLEDHFVNASPSIKQPNLYSIVEGHFDSFFAAWAQQIKQVKGTVLLRILHEFNGDWYPWCIAKNDNNPDLLVRAFRHIVDVMRSQQITNIRFVWCPNSMSLPQTPWNFIMDAYPGDIYVDFTGLDIYNGAGSNSHLWRSFRKEGIENYFLLTQRLPQKPLVVCETSSRERREAETGYIQNKGEWIEQMSRALKTDMSRIRLLSWFNETNAFKINSSRQSVNAYENFILKEAYFKNGKAQMELLMK
jgi:beta-mannanase